MRADPEIRVMVFAAMALVCVIAIGVWASVEDARQWEAFSKANDCKVIGRTRSQITYGTGMALMPSGQLGVVNTSTTTPAMTGYVCKDGVTYWR